MSFLKELANQLSNLWGTWSRTQQVLMVVSAVVCLASIAGVGVWATRPEYIALVDHLGPGDAAEVVSTLEAAGIDYKLNFSGSAISVPRQSVSRARLALKDVIDTESTQDESLDGGIWADPGLSHVRILRQQESRLSRSIAQMRTVRNATVHISQPEPTPFVRDRESTKASVVLDLKPGAHFTRADAQSIVSLVSHGVEGLDPANVTVLDTEGRLLSSNNGFEADVTGQLEYRRRLEADLAAKAETMLSQLLGPGRAVVRVTADIDFTETEREETTYDPDGKVKLSEEVTSEQTTGMQASAAGAAGTASNVGGGAGGGSRNPVTTKIESNKTEYANAEVRDRVREAPGKIRRLTVAAIVSLPDASADTADATAAPATPASYDKAQIEGIIKQAVGFDAQRSDEIEVLDAPLLGAPEQLAPPAGFAWTQYEKLLRTVSLGLASLVALLLGAMLIRRMKPVIVESEGAGGTSSDVAQRLQSLSQEARDNPEALATALSAWLGDTESSEDEQPPQTTPGPNQSTARAA
ncbi:flagellar basal-body MS-ring/collar protein FliF [Maioricimonas sp. JC845]|uniref:flagellar basal-body MS-ring/collar protein FliF n=1 Tax=Maioricimonas sp. JC845 TaxID=3232138 RepID=UPI00345B0165